MDHVTISILVHPVGFGRMMADDCSKASLDIYFDILEMRAGHLALNAF